MTKTEFLALEFGSDVFDKDGVHGVVINKFRDGDVTMAWSKPDDRVLLVRVSEADTIFLEKPKKRVKKERIMYTDKRGIIFLSQEEGIELTLSDEIDSELYYIPVTITYETEG